MSEKVKARRKFMKSMVLTNATTNFVANGGCYYGLSHGVEKTAVGFLFNGVATAFILALICGAFAILTVDSKCKKGAFPADNYRWGDHMLVDSFPKKNKWLQLLVASLWTAVIFIPVSAGIPVLIGCAGKTIPVMTGAIAHGFQAGLMALTINYFMMVCRCCSFAAEQEA